MLNTVHKKMVIELDNEPTECIVELRQLKTTFRQLKEA